MEGQPAVAYPAPIALLAAAPGALYLVAVAARALAAGPAAQYVLLLLVTLVALAFVAGIVRSARLPTWTLPGIGLALPVLLAAVWDILLPLPAGRQIANILLPGLGLLAYALAAYAACRRPHAEGPAAALLLVPPLALLAFTIMDPTYGFNLYFDNRLLAPGFETLTLLPALVLLPASVLRARSRRAQARRLLTLSALSFELMALTPLLTAVARVQQNVLNAPPLATAVTHILLVRTTFAAFFWLLLALVVLLTETSSLPLRRRTAV